MSDKVQEFRVDVRQTTSEEFEKGKKQAQLVFELNHTMPLITRQGEGMLPIYIYIY